MASDWITRLFSRLRAAWRPSGASGSMMSPKDQAKMREDKGAVFLDEKAEVARAILAHTIPLVLLSPTAFLMQPVRWLRAITRFGATLSPAPIETTLPPCSGSAASMIGTWSGSAGSS